MISCKELNYTVHSDALIKYYNGAIFGSEFASFIKTVRIKCA